MDRDKEVGTSFVSNIGTLLQRNEHIRLTSIDNSDVWASLLHQLSECECYVEVDYFFLGQLTYSASIVTTVAGINHESKSLVSGICANH